MYLLGKYCCQFKDSHGRCQEVTEIFWVREGEWWKPWPPCCFLQCVFFMSLVLRSALFSQLPLGGGASEYKNVREKCRQETQRRLPCCFIGLILGLGNSKLSVTESDYIAQYIQKTPRCFQLIFFFQFILLFYIVFCPRITKPSDLFVILWQGNAVSSLRIKKHQGLDSRYEVPAVSMKVSVIASEQLICHTPVRQKCRKEGLGGEEHPTSYRLSVSGFSI